MFVVVLFNMSDIKIFYHTPFLLSDKQRTVSWLERVAFNEKRTLFSLEYNFVDKNEMIRINTKHLGHNYLTDVLSFNYSQTDKIHGEVFVSVDAVRENALDLDEVFDTELHRVLLHGLLHLCGHNDKTEKEIRDIRLLENKYLSNL